MLCKLETAREEVCLKRTEKTVQILTGYALLLKQRHKLRSPTHIGIKMTGFWVMTPCGF